MHLQIIHNARIFSPSAVRGSCHAATIVETAAGHLVAAWFGGTHEGHPDVAIWLARHDGSGWSEPVKLLDEPGVPLWNPVLFRDGADTLWLFYKAGPTVPAWSGLFVRSTDGGVTWSEPVLLPAGLLGPAKNKPITLSNGDILCGTSSETWQNWASWVEVSGDGGRSWTKHGPITVDGVRDGHARSDQVSAVWDTATKTLLLPQEHPGVIQPTLWETAPGRVRMLLRATRRIGAVCLAESLDYGRTWSQARPLPIPHPNSGLDAARMADGRVVLVCNPVLEGRTPLAVLLSADNGESWSAPLNLVHTPGEYSYPSVIAAQDGRVHVVFTDDRQSIRHVVLASDDSAHV